MRSPPLLLLRSLVLLILCWQPGCERGAPLPAPLDPALVRAAAVELQQAAAGVPDDDPARALLDQALRRRAQAELERLLTVGEAPQLDRALETATRASQALLADLLAGRGATVLRGLAARETQRTVEQLAAALPALAAAGGVPELRRSLPAGSPGRRALDEGYGSFLLGAARSSGLLDAHGVADPQLPSYAAVLLHYRLLREAERLGGVPLPLPPAMRRIFLHWRVERASDARRETRLAALAELLRLEPDYPARAARQRLEVGR